MPLDARKLAHMQSKWARITLNRQQSVILTFRTGAGGTSTLQVNAVWRVVDDADPTLSEEPDLLPHGSSGSPDVIATFLQKDVSYAQLRSCIWATLAPGQPGPPVALKYILATLAPIGTPAGGDRWLTTWIRQH